jgi:hypothetical protein
MDFDEYVAARYGSLLRAAVLMGCATERAPAVVEQVLARSERRIRHAEDPDPLVHEALAHAIPGARLTDFGAHPEARQDLLMSAEPVPVDAVGVGHLEVPPRDRNLPAVTALVVLVLLLVGAGLVGPGHREPGFRLAFAQVPSLFGYDDAHARALLAHEGVTVVEEKIPACEPIGRVLGSRPESGALILRGTTLTLRTAAPSVATCLHGYADRELAWELVDFATGHGPAPVFAPMVRLVVDGGEPTTLQREQAVVRGSWDGLSAVSALADASTQVRIVGTTYRLPRLTVTRGVAPPSTCGVSRSLLAGHRTAVSISISVPGEAAPTCPMRVDVYRTSGEIDAIMLYTRKPSPRV